MSYTQQPSQSVTLSWVGASAYAQQPSGAVEIAWPTGDPTALGFRSTEFGSPVTLADQSAVAQGWSAVAAGGPIAISTARGVATGFRPEDDAVAGIGIATAVFTTPEFVGAIHSTEFGAPSATQYSLAATAGISTVFGTPSWPRPIAAAASGSLRSKYGAPIAYNLPTSAAPRIVPASGFGTTQFGAASAAHYALSGAVSTQFGAVRARSTAFASGDLFGGMGLPSAGAAGRAAGFTHLGLGAPSALRGQSATGLSASRFGEPRALRSSGHPTYAIGPLTRFARPSAHRRFNHPAFGSSSSQFGAPAATQQYDALHLAPGTRFGRPQRARSTEC